MFLGELMRIKMVCTTERFIACRAVEGLLCNQHGSGLSLLQCFGGWTSSKDFVHVPVTFVVPLQLGRVFECLLAVCTKEPAVNEGLVLAASIRSGDFGLIPRAP